MKKKVLILIAILLPLLSYFSCLNSQPKNTWETVEINLTASGHYDNPYTDVELWVVLSGKGFNTKVYGFWDGDNNFKVRMIAPEAGTWKWESFSEPYDKGLSGKKGKFTAKNPGTGEIEANSNLRGFIRTNPDAPHGFIYADGTPFFMLADTWWAASTWRFPFKGGIYIPDNYIPGEDNWSFEGGIQWLKKYGYNSIAIISCFPNWKIDQYGPAVNDDNNVAIRDGGSWGKAPDGKKVKDMHDESGNLPFMFPGKSAGKQDVCADYDRINPAYWQSFDKKMDYLWKQGFVPYIETIRRDQIPPWVAYHNFNESFARYLNYFRARYGSYNFIYSLVHVDALQRGVSNENLKEAFLYYHKKYGGMPFGQPVTAMMRDNSLKYLGHIDKAPYITCHSGGNTNRSHGILKEMKNMFDAVPPVPVFNNEPFYPLINNISWARAGGVITEPNSELDNYFGRTHMYSNFFSGAYASYIFGTGAFGGDTHNEPAYSVHPFWPKIYDALKIDALKQGLWYRKFINSLGIAYQSMIPAHEDLSEPRTDTEAMFDWSFLLKSTDNKLVLLYFERNAKRQDISNLLPNKSYTGTWFNTRTGEWVKMKDQLKSDNQGKISMPSFPNGENLAEDDWVAKLELNT